METQTCGTCHETKYLTEEYWYRNCRNITGFSRKCTDCTRIYYSKNLKSARSKRKEALADMPKPNEKEFFGDFEAACLRDKVATLKTAPISLYQEIASEPVA